MFHWLISSAAAEETATAAELAGMPEIAVDAPAADAAAEVSAAAGASTAALVWPIVFAVLLAAGVVAWIVWKRRKVDLKMVGIGALCVGLSTGLSALHLPELAHGGAVTLAGMLPVMLFAAAYGVGPGAVAGAVLGFLCYMMGGRFANALQFLLCYPVAYGLVGLTGLYRCIRGRLRDRINHAVNGLLNKLCSLFVRLFSLAMKGPERKVWVKDYAPDITIDWIIAVCMLIGAAGRYIAAVLGTAIGGMMSVWSGMGYHAFYLVPDVLICLLIAIFAAEPALRLLRGEHGPHHGKPDPEKAPVPAPDRKTVEEEPAEEPEEEPEEADDPYEDLTSLDKELGEEENEA